MRYLKHMYEIYLTQEKENEAMSRELVFDYSKTAGFIREEEKGLDFSATLGDDFKIAKDKETQKECVEIKLQGT